MNEKRYIDVVATHFEMRDGQYGPYGLLRLQDENGNEYVKFMNLPKSEGQQRHWRSTFEALGIAPEDPMEGPFGQTVAVAVEEFDERKGKPVIKYINKPRTEDKPEPVRLDAEAARNAIAASLGSVNPF
jgi:hypothetical protein